MRVTELSLAVLKPAPNNPRTHTDDQIEAVARSIRRFGFTNPVLVDASRTIVAGHARVLAARRLGLEKVPCISLDKLSPEDVRAYVVADNQLALRSGWDEELLLVELKGLKDLGYDVTLTGFESKEIDELLAATKRLGRTDEDDIPAPPKRALVQSGEIWCLGPHRLLCGDSTVAADVARLLGEQAPQLMVTDPPYGVDYDPGWRAASGNGSARAAEGKVANDHRASWSDAWRYFPGRVAYVWHGGLHAGTVAQSLLEVGFQLRAQIVWVKARPALSRGAYHWGHEPCWYAVRPEDSKPFEDGWRFEQDQQLAAYAVRDGKNAGWKGGRKQSTVWYIDHHKNESGHGTEKPVECMRRCVLNNSAAGQAVYEPFAGSGTTLIAAEQTGRVCLAVELNPVYCDMAIRRWQEFTGQRAAREDGRSFGKA